MKKSSDNTNRPRKLEEVFRDGFEPAEVSPRASIWHHIEQELEVQQTGYYKKRLVWYRSVAAASVTLLLVALSYFWYDTQTSHRLNVPGATPEVIVQNKNNQAAEETASTKSTNTPDQYGLAENLKKETPNENSVTLSQPAQQLTFSSNQQSKKNNWAATQANPTQLASGRQTSPEPSLVFQNITSGANKTVLDETQAEKQQATTRKNEFALQATPPAISNTLPEDSAQVLIAKNQPEFKKDSAAVITAALMPEETKKKNIGSRWALGGGTGSQYFEQNIKFANAGNNAFSNDAALSYSAAPVAKNPMGNTIEAASKEFNENTRSAFSYRAAVAANYRINDKWSIEAGLNFAENKAQTTTSYIIYKRPAALNTFANIKSENANRDSNSNSLTTNVNIPVTIFLANLTDTDVSNAQVTVEKVSPFNMYYRYRQLGLPVRLRYQHGQGKWFNFVQAGGAVNVLLQTSILSDSPKVPAVEYSVGHSSPFRKWYLTGLGSIGRGLKITDVWQIQGSLDVAYSFSTLALSPDQLPNVSQQKPYYLGFGVSSSYVIGKK